MQEIVSSCPHWTKPKIWVSKRIIIVVGPNTMNEWEFMRPFAIKKKKKQQKIFILPFETATKSTLYLKIDN